MIEPLETPTDPDEPREPLVVPPPPPRAPLRTAGPSEDRPGSPGSSLARRVSDELVAMHRAARTPPRGNPLGNLASNRELAQSTGAQGGKPKDHPSPNAPAGRERAYAPPCRHRGPFVRLAKTACPLSPRATVFRCLHPERSGHEVVLNPARRCSIPSCKRCLVRTKPRG